MSDLLIKKRSITKPESNVKAILYSKLKQYQEQDLPIEILTDYIGKGCLQIEDEIEQLKNYKTIIDSKIKDLELQKINVRVQSAEFLRENGIEKLDGIEFSSITITEKKEASEKKEIVKTFFTDLKKEEINDFLVTQNLGKYTKKEEIRVIAEVPEMIKINKKKAKKEKDESNS